MKENNMIDRRTVLLGLAAANLFSSRAQAASNGLPFEAAAFRAAQSAGKTIVLEITAKWCVECQRQRPIVAKLLERPEFSQLTMFDADYDVHKKELLEINALQLTTLILYRGGKEVARSSGATSPEAVEAFFGQAL
jgi:thiol:disulfide interchange protein